MKINAVKSVDFITNYEVENIAIVKEAYKSKCKKIYEKAKNVYEASEIEEGIEFRCTTSLDCSEECVKYFIYFPDYLETQCFVKLNNDDEKIVVDFRFPRKTFKKTYFNIVLLNKYDEMIMADSVVFDEKARIKEMQKINEMKSNLVLRDCYVEEVNIVCSMKKIDEEYKLRFVTKFSDVDSNVIIKHIWMNMTIMKVQEILISKDSNVGISEFTISDKEFCKGFWQVIAMEDNKFICQGSINIT